MKAGTRGLCKGVALHQHGHQEQFEVEANLLVSGCRGSRAPAPPKEADTASPADVKHVSLRQPQGGTLTPASSMKGADAQDRVAVGQTGWLQAMQC